jgi:hypothetical protein
VTASDGRIARPTLLPWQDGRVPAGSRNTLGVCNLCEAICGLELTIEGDGPEAR